MFTTENKEIINLEANIIESYDMHKIAYFDIETTGFDKDNDFIVLISLGYFDEDGLLNIKQYFAEDLQEEGEVLHSFGADVRNFNRWSSYNGMAFDEPFIERRMEKNNIAFIKPAEHVDLYRVVRPYHMQLGMDRCNLKTVEKYLGVVREDKIDGGISVELYNEYLKTKEEKLKDLIMLHNFEDVLNLPRIFTLLYEIENNEELKREDIITEKQLRLLKSLVKKHKLTLYYKLDNISKKAASKVIDSIINGNLNSSELNNMIISSY